jgi:hypothetical protein
MTPHGDGRTATETLPDLTQTGVIVSALPKDDEPPFSISTLFYHMASQISVIW